MSAREEYESKLQARLDLFDVEIEQLKARADKAEEQPWHKKQIEALQEKQKVAKEKLGQLKVASDDAWEDLKDGLGSAWDSVGNALKSVAKRFD